MTPGAVHCGAIPAYAPITSFQHCFLSGGVPQFFTLIQETPQQHLVSSPALRGDLSKLPSIIGDVVQSFSLEMLYLTKTHLTGSTSAQSEVALLMAMYKTWCKQGFDLEA